MNLKIILEVDNKKIELTEQEAMELKDKLDVMFSKPTTVPYLVPIYPYPKYPIITYYYKYDNSSTASEKENPCSSYTRSFSWENSSDNVNRVLCGGMVS